MFEALSEKLEGIFKKLKGRGLLREEDIASALKEIKMALLEADVNFKVVKDFTEKVRVKAIGKEVTESITPGQQVVKIVYDELCSLMGGKHSKINLSPNPPTVLMLVGLHGSGKTTTTAKLAKSFKKDGRRPVLVAMDTARPAAIDQLITLGAQIDVPVYSTRAGDSPIRICADAIKKANSEGRDVVILDTAGRLHIDEQLMKELEEIKKEAKPKEILLVADAMTGQDAVNIAKSFDKKKLVLVSVLLISGTVFTISPWTIRNYVVTKKFIPVSTGIGNVLSLGVKTDYSKPRYKLENLSKVHGDFDYQHTVEDDETLFKKSLSLIKYYPSDYIKQVFWKILSFWYWSGSQLKNTINLIVNIPLLICAIAGFIYARRENLLILPILAAIIYFNFLHALTHSISRYSMPVIPYVILFAAYGILKLKGSSLVVNNNER